MNIYIIVTKELKIINIISKLFTKKYHENQVLLSKDIMLDFFNYIIVNSN
jgi:hypothetical protein